VAVVSDDGEKRAGWLMHFRLFLPVRTG